MGEPGPWGTDSGAGTGITAVLDRLLRPYDPAAVLEALLGLDRRSARRVVGETLATSAEASRLLREMPATVRALAIATTDAPERCHGELRGPIMWAETVSARAATAGDPGLFVCATTTRAYDTDSNRVLVAALDALRRSARAAVDGVLQPAGRSLAARHNGQVAERFLEHPTLSNVARVRPDGRAIRRARVGGRRGTYSAAIALLGRAGDLVSAELFADHADQPATRGVELLGRVLDVDRFMARRAARAELVLRPHLGFLAAGPVRYRHDTGSPQVLIGDRSVTPDVREDDLSSALTAAGVNVDR